MIEVVLNDRLGKKVRVKCNDDDTIGDLKKLVAAQTGTRSDKIRIQKWYTLIAIYEGKSSNFHWGLSLFRQSFLISMFLLHQIAHASGKIPFTISCLICTWYNPMGQSSICSRPEDNLETFHSSGLFCP
ncbi:hypothetical protein QQP08_005052 [Theobroma cacao]|nr:hypothetical protein QQP08_005052 [Theobroma cacao]